MTGSGKTGLTTVMIEEAMNTGVPALVALGEPCETGQGACRASGRTVCAVGGRSTTCSSSGNTPDARFHNVQASNGSWDWNCNESIEQQYRHCEDMSPADCNPNTNERRKPGGFCTGSRGVDRCPMSPAACGQNILIYPCFLAADGRCHAGGYDSSATMGCR